MAAIKIHMKDSVNNRIVAFPRKHGKHVHAVAEGKNVQEVVAQLEELGLDHRKDVAFMFIPPPGTHIYSPGLGSRPS